MVDLALCLVNLRVKLQLQEVIALERIGVAGEFEGLGLELELQLGGLDIGYGDGQVEVVLCGVSLVGALGPKD